MGEIKTRGYNFLKSKEYRELQVLMKNIIFEEKYTDSQLYIKTKFERQRTTLHMVSFELATTMEDDYQLSQLIAMEGMHIFANRLADWRNDRCTSITYHPWSFDEHPYPSEIIIFGIPTGVELSYDEFIRFNSQKNKYSIAPQYDLHDVDIPPLYKALTACPYDGTVCFDQYEYELFLNNFIFESEFKNEDFVIYQWSDDWSNFFDPGKEWWGTFYWTIYNKANNRMIVLGSSETELAP